MKNKTTRGLGYKNLLSFPKTDSLKWRILKSNVNSHMSILYIENDTVSSFTIKLKELFLQLNHKVQYVDEFSCAICKHVVLCQCFGNRS
jgi:hypothetical protein